jgi:DNA-binding transcriptional MerR regulator
MSFTASEASANVARLGGPTNRSCPLETAGQRLYSRDQVDQLSFIRNEIEHGLQPADAHRLLAQHQMEMASNPEE